MANLTADRVKETTTTTGTGTITLAGAASQFRSFASAFADGNVVQYAIVGQTGTEWEVGNGTIGASGTTLARTTVLASSNANAAVNFSAGTKDVFATVTAAHLLAAVLGPDIQGPIEGFSITGGTSTTADLVLKTTTGVGGSGSLMRFLVGNNGALEAMRLLYDGQAVFRTINIGSSNGTDSDAKIAFDQSAGYFGSGTTLGWGNATTPAGYGYSRDTAYGRFAAGVFKITDGSTGIRSLQGGGAAVASAAALPVPTGRVFHVTGTTNITSITSTNLQAGVVITLIFDGILTVTDGGNLKLAGNFVTAADSTLSLVYDGTNWYETGRSTN